MASYQAGMRHRAGSVLYDGVEDHETYQCAHCGGHFEVLELQVAPDMCRNCMEPICRDRPECRQRCIPFEAWLESKEGTRIEWKQEPILEPGLFLPRPLQRVLEDAEAELADSVSLIFRGDSFIHELAKAERLRNEAVDAVIT